MSNEINYRKIKTTLSKLSCPVHHQKADITLSKDGLEISACCEYFHKKLKTKIEQLAADQINEMVLKSLRFNKR